MKKIAFLCIFLTSFQIHASTCRVPKTLTVCERHCCYNYYGPGVHCKERCVTKPFKPTLYPKAC